jgi:long-subunit fatty acid transport protein
MRNAAAAAAAFLVPAAAFAGGYAIPNTNARDLGMAESVVADQHGPSAVYGNSAALAGMEGFGITAGVQAIYFRSTWNDPTGGLPGSTDTLKKLVTPPELYVAYGSKYNGMAYGLGAGFTVVGGGYVFWPDDWQGRTRVYVVDRKVYNFIISGGIEPVKGVKLGLGGVYFRTTEKLKQGVGAAQGEIDVGTAGGAFSWTGSFEVQPLQALPLKLGLNYRHQAVQYLTGQAHAGNIPPSLVVAGGLFDQGITHELSFPNVLQVGAAYRVLPQLLVAVAFQLSRFHLYKQDAFIGDQGTQVFVDRQYRNQTVYRLGGEYAGLLPGLTVRAGLLRDKSPQPAVTVDPSLPDSSSWAFNLGASYDVTSKITGSIGFEHAIFDRITTPAGVPFPGSYKTKADLLGITFDWRL